MTGGPLLWHPSSGSVLRSSSETTSALCGLPHWTQYNLHTAESVPQTTLLPSPCTLLSPTWKIRTPMWGCCSWIIVQHFNTIVPATLVEKLQTLGLNRSLCSWILDFLTGRSQVVRMGNNTSSPLILNTGAPQGCVLSPLLYSLYTHDCTATHSSNVIVKFADDTTVIGLITDNDETAYREEVSTLTKWCQELVVDFRRQSREHTPISIDKTPVERVNSFKFFGVHITEDLTWSAHTDAVLKKAHQRLFFLRRLRKCGMSPSILRSFYTCTVESILTGCITAWFGNSTAGNRKALQRVVRTAATLLEVSFPPSRTSTPGGV